MCDGPMCRNGLDVPGWLPKNFLAGRSTMTLTPQLHQPTYWHVVPSEGFWCHGMWQQQQWWRISCFGTVDVKDSFFMVDQVTPMAVSLLGRTYKVKKNLPGQRLGARAWYWAFRETLVRNLACHGAPNSHAWLEINSAEVLQSAFTVARCWMWDAVLEKNLEACWYRFGFGSRNKRHEGGWDVATAAFKLRTAVIFSVVPMPAPYAFRSVIGIRWTRSFLLWRSWVAQFSSLHTAVGRLRKLIGYLKTTSDFCLNGRAARSIGFLRRSLTLIGLDTNHTGDPPHEEFMPQRWLPLFKQCCQP